MINALLRAIGQLFDARILGLIGACAVLSIACFVGLLFAVDWLLELWVPAEGWVRTTVDALGWIATLLLAWFLFPLVMTAFVGLFLENVARAVEARHYPGLPKAPGLPFLTGLGASLRFLAIVVAANLLLLLLLLVLPPVYPVAYVVVNGWLLGREYFELVALRRFDPARARSLRLAHQNEIVLTGALFTLLLPLPLVNLVIPIVATATMVHRFEDWRRSTPAQPVGG